MPAERIEKAGQEQLIKTTMKSQASKAEGPVLQAKNDLRAKLKKALEFDDLCYNYETGFHYMKQ